MNGGKMERKHFVLKLFPLRSDLFQTMTDEERLIMQRHIAYWKEQMDKGFMLVFGPVFDPRRPHGLGIVSVENEHQLHTLVEDDPATMMHRYEYYPMGAVTPTRRLGLKR
jgi:uncharacterized protein YciI